MAVELSDDGKEFYEERAAIREFDGGQGRKSAEAAAMAETVEHMFRCEVRSIIAMRVEHGLPRAQKFLVQIESKRGADATARLREAINAQWSKGNRGKPGEWI